ncbi:substrate-binding periplasmic protein [Roseibium sp.]|uniref:substrate-binding periplasmic protein n=1 Tax=Roseibium sp. TaxID=1936156 RepID=UPI003BAE9F58
MKRPRVILCLYCLMLIFGVGRSVLADPREPVTILAVNYPPFEMDVPVDGLHGFDHETVVEAFHRVGVEARIIYVPWTRAVSDTRNGLSPALLSCARNAERERDFLFSAPISQDTYGLYYRKDFKPPEIRKLEDVIGQSVASVSGYASLAKLIEIGANPVEVQSETMGFKMLALGRFDFLYSGKQSTDFQIMQLGMTDQFGFVVTENWDYHLCFSRRHPLSETLLPLFDKGLAEIRADGTYKKIHDRYR